MRELSVYYCPRCGRYGYYQLTRNAHCPTCNIEMQLLNMRYQDFMRLNPEERDALLIQKILAQDPSISNRIAAAGRAHNHRKVIASLHTRIRDLESENRRLNETVEWMHQTIWDLLARNKALERQLSSEDSEPDSEPPPKDRPS